MDETAYLMSTPANKGMLEKSMQQDKNGEHILIKHAALWETTCLRHGYQNKFRFFLEKLQRQKSMRHVIVYTTDKEYGHFVQLAKSLNYVKKVETDDEPTKEEILDNIKAGLEEVKLFKKGKLKTTPAKDFLNEL